MVGRRSPFQRAKNSLVLQERDKKIIAFVHDYRFLTQNQIQVLSGFGCQTRVNIRLRKLFDASYLSRRFLPNFQGRAKILYFLGPKGMEIVSEKLGIDPQEIKQKRKQLLKIKNSSFSHYLSINEFKLAFSLASKDNPKINLELWKVQKETPLSLGEKEFYPDAHFVYSYRDKFYSLFLEIDCSTESSKRFQEKVSNYWKYGFSGYYQRQSGFKFFRVLVVCQSRARLKNLKKLIEEKTDRMFWLGLQEDILPEKILAKIWHRPDKEYLFSLLEN